MKRLVIGGPEKYDNTFVDWPEDHLYWRVHVSNPNRFNVFEEVDFLEYTSPNLDIHTYSLQTIVLANKQRFLVWRSTKLDLYGPIENKYVYNLIGATDLWQRFYDQSKMAYIYQYYCFGEWHTYWKVSNEVLNRFAGIYRYEEWLVRNLIEQRNEMRCYTVERVDQTAEIGSSDS